MIDIQSFNKSLKATWIKKYLDEENQGKWKYFFDIELERFGGTIVLTSNLNKKDTIENLKIKNNFIKEILSIWAEVNFDENKTSFNDLFCLKKDVHQYNTRSSSNVHKIQARTNYQKHSV